ncbi:hypothetical protein [Candidatus Thioglobus sp.]|uniref:hypothetical protein n=1 Tax=Candidatus Thioglobus sp. TaxID=2026721 RepID=UPI003D0BB1C6
MTNNLKKIPFLLVMYSGFAFSEEPVPSLAPDLLSILPFGGINLFDAAITAIIFIFSALIVVYIAAKGSKFIMAMVNGDDGYSSDEDTDAELDSYIVDTAINQKRKRYVDSLVDSY